MNNFEFRGIKINTKDFIYGFVVRFQKDNGDFIYYIQEDTTLHINNVRDTLWEVIPETIGMRLGFNDNAVIEEHPNGKPIYQGDIMEFRGEYKTRPIEGKKVKSPWFHYDLISYEQGGFKRSIVKQENSWFGDLPSPPTQITEYISKGVVIGNIHTDLHLLV